MKKLLSLFLCMASVASAQVYFGKVVVIPYQVQPTYGSGLNIQTYGSGFSSYHNIMQNCGYAKVTNATANTVACFGEGEAALSGAHSWGGNHVGITSASGATAIADEIDTGVIVSGGTGYGAVIGCTGYYPCASAIQVQANRWAAPWTNGLVFNSSNSLGQDVTGDLIDSSNPTIAQRALKMAGIFTAQEMYLPSFQVAATPTNKLIGSSITGNGTTATVTFSAATVNFPWVGSTMTLSGFGNAGFNASCTVTAASTTTASCLNATNSTSTNGAVAVSNPTITVTGASVSSGTVTLTYANSAATGYPAAGNKIIVDSIVSAGNGSGTDLTGYNGSFTVVTSSATQLTYADTQAAGTYVSGGTIDDYPIAAVTAVVKMIAANAPGNTAQTTVVSAGLGATNANWLLSALGTGFVELGTSTTYADSNGLLFTAGQITSSLATGTAPFSIASTTNVPNLNASLLNGATFAAPGSIGSGTPGSGAFTTISGTTISGTTISGTNITSAPTSTPTIDAGNVPFTLISAGVPFIFNTCTLNATGAISACATMPSTYANAYMYFNANKLAASGNGSAVGFYYVQMSSATAGQACQTGGVFTLYVSGSPTIPASCAAPASGVAVGANTIPNTIMLGPTTTLIAHSMGKNGSLECHTAFSQTNSANTRTLTLKFGTASILMAPTTVVQGSQIAEVVNAGSEAAQVSNLLGTNSTTAQTFSTQPSRTTVDSGSNVTISWNQTMNTNTEFYVLERYSCRVWPN